MLSTTDWRPAPRAKKYFSDIVIPKNYFIDGLNFGDIYSELVHTEDYTDYTFKASDFDIGNIFYVGNSAQIISGKEAGIKVEKNGTIAINTDMPIYQNLYNNQTGEVYASFSVTDPNGLTDHGIVQFKVQGSGKNNNNGPQAKTFHSGITLGVNTVQTGLNFGVIYSELVHTEDYPDYIFDNNDFTLDKVVFSVENTFNMITAAEAGLSVSNDGNITIDTSSKIYQYMHYGQIADVYINFTVTDPKGLRDQGHVVFNVEQLDPTPDHIEYFLYNAITNEKITLCDYNDEKCIESLRQIGYYMLTPETYGEDRYAYPAVYKSPGIVWDLSEEKRSNGNWTLYSKFINTDQNGDGFVDDVDHYRMWSLSGGIDLKTSRGQTLSEDSSSSWDAIKAIEHESGFAILLAGKRRKEGSFCVINTDNTGIINSMSTWMNKRQLSRSGYVEIFNISFNQSPSEITLSSSIFNENIIADSIVATLKTVDPDAKDSHTYSLISGEGDSDNDKFTISNNQLKIQESPDYETQQSYSIRLQTEDSEGLALESSFTLSVTDIEEAPSEIQLSSFEFDENISVGTVVALLNTTDPDSGDTHSYSLVNGDGDEDNNQFKIKGARLKIMTTPDFEIKDKYLIRLQTEDSSGLTFEDSFTLSVNNLEEGPIDADRDGFVDKVTNYQMWTAFGGVDLKNSRGQIYSDDTSKIWDLTKAVEINSGFSILLEGKRNKEGSYRVITAKETGVISGASTWMNERQMFRGGYEQIFEIDFNGNNIIDFI